ncbi:hypothetical protein B0H10DRAFT_899124 [Mycena sp. CBHHK59/15]|nr:hypothetical protein B0H10DRAFT_899124 [Mycena sp. CBHHK59/15]
MRFSTVLLFALPLASIMAGPVPAATPPVDSLVSKASTVIAHLSHLNTLGAQIVNSSSAASTPQLNAAINHINRIVDSLVPVQSGGLLDGLLGGLLAGGGGLGLLLGGDGDILSGLLPGDPLGDLLGGTNGGGLLGGDLLGGLLNGLLGGILGEGGLLSGLLGGGSDGLLVSISDLLELFPDVGSSCGTDLVGELLSVVKDLVGSLTDILPDAQQCACGQNQALRTGVASLIKASKDQLAPIRTH